VTTWDVFADAAENLYPARMQMAVSLGWHIVFACFGIAFPLITLFTEWRGHRRGDAHLLSLPHTWAKAMGVLFAAGAVSGTLLSFEMGILWPGLMDRFGEVFGFPFVLEGFAFFIEAIFVGVCLFGWDRLSPRAHMLSAIPMIVSGMAGAFFVVAANAWMNNPTGFDLAADGSVVDPQPWAARFGPSTWPQVVHMLLPQTAAAPDGPRRWAGRRRRCSLRGSRPDRSAAGRCPRCKRPRGPEAPRSGRPLGLA
jgi:cytochrome d ubiquinol oxidase subunit I